MVFTGRCGSAWVVDAMVKADMRGLVYRLTECSASRALPLV